MSDSQIGSGWNNACLVIHPYSGGRLSTHDPYERFKVTYTALNASNCRTERLVPVTKQFYSN
jgi:hypothetical protein